MKPKFIAFIAFTTMVVISCSSCKSDTIEKSDMNKINSISNGNLTFEGRIAVVGNEPFTKLGLFVNDSTIYILECENDIEETLKKNQGYLYKITAKEKTRTEFGIKLIVKKIEKIKQ